MELPSYHFHLQLEEEPMKTMKGIKKESVFTTDHTSIEACKKFKDVPLVIVIDDDDDMDVVQSVPEPKSVVFNASSDLEDPFSVDVKPLHHELHIEDITEGEIEDQSDIQCQQDRITAEVQQLRLYRPGHTNLDFSVLRNVV